MRLIGFYTGILVACWFVPIETPEEAFQKEKEKRLVFPHK
jgi:hypothetical protein